MNNIFDSLGSIYIIAEIGVNHNGDMGLAKEMISAASESGANAVKFQTFFADRLVTPSTPKVNYQRRSQRDSETHYEMIKKLELSYENHFILREHADHNKLHFLSTPYDIESAKFLNDELNIRYFKTASADIVDIPLHEYIASTGKPAIISVGIASVGEIEKVFNVYDRKRNLNIAFLHCVSNYPCSDTSLNLKAIKTLNAVFDVPIGYSDHSVGPVAAILSVALGSKIIEKHFTLDKTLSGPDHLASSTPEEFRDMVEMVRRAEQMLGSARKKMQAEEVEMSKASRKSLVYNRSLRMGEVISDDDLSLKRPGTGIGYEFLAHLVGKKLKENKYAGDLVDLGDFC